VTGISNKYEKSQYSNTLKERGYINMDSLLILENGENKGEFVMKSLKKLIEKFEKNIISLKKVNLILQCKESRNNNFRINAFIQYRGI
jgi:hypothetical protein